jgi:hypothetical protein
MQVGPHFHLQFSKKRIFPFVEDLIAIYKCDFSSRLLSCLSRVHTLRHAKGTCALSSNLCRGQFSQLCGPPEMYTLASASPRASPRGSLCTSTGGHADIHDET